MLCGDICAQWEGTYPAEAMWGLAGMKQKTVSKHDKCPMDHHGSPSVLLRSTGANSGPFKALHASLKHCSVVSRLISTGELTPAEACKQCIYEVAVVALAAV